MLSKDQDIAVAVYDEHSTAEEAVKTLQRGGFDMKKISIVGKDYETDEHVVGFLNAGDRAKIFGKLGAFWGGLFGILFGAALIFIPVIGSVVILARSQRRSSVPSKAAWKAPWSWALSVRWAVRCRQSASRRIRFCNTRRSSKRTSSSCF